MLQLLINHLWLTTSLGVVGLVLFYKYLTRNFDYWTSRGVPGWKPYPFLGTMWYAFFKYSLPGMHAEGFRRYGKLFGGFGGSAPILMVADPELIRAICIKDFDAFANRTPMPFPEKMFQKFMVNLEGEDWKRVRSTVSPTFSSGKMKRMYPLIDECVADFVRYVEAKQSEGHEDLEIKDICGRVAFDIIARVAFAIKTKNPDGSRAAALDEFMQHAKAMFNPSMWRVFCVMTLPRSIVNVLGLSIFAPEHTDFMRRTVLQLVSQRQESRLVAKERSAKLPVDYLQLLLDAGERDPTGSGQQVVQTIQDEAESFVTETAEEREAYAKTMSASNGSGQPGYISRLHLDSDEIIAQACLFLMAGLEAARMTLSLVAYALALHPEVQERLYQTLSDLVQDQDPDAKVDYDAIFNEPYLNAVLNEAMRVYFPGNMLDRRATRDYTLPAPYSHVTITKGTTVWILQQSVHQDPDSWEEPQKFDPERFMPENEHKIKPYSFLPFGVGPRNCVAMRFALMELKLILARLVLAFRFRTTRNTPHELKYTRTSGFVMKLEKEIKLAMEKRN